jgi:hypothetical protein
MQSHAAIDDVFDDQNVGARERDVQILGDLYFARGGSFLPIARDADEIDESVAVDGTREIRQEETGAFQDADEIEGSVGVVGGNLRADLADARLNPVFGEKRAEGQGFIVNPG